MIIIYNDNDDAKNEQNYRSISQPPYVFETLRSLCLRTTSYCDLFRMLLAEIFNRRLVHLNLIEEMSLADSLQFYVNMTHRDNMKLKKRSPNKIKPTPALQLRGEPMKLRIQTTLS